MSRDTGAAEAAAKEPVLPRWPAALPALVLLTTAIAILADRDRINHDCAMYLQCGQLLVDGNMPYVDFVDLNPPFVMYLNAVPALIARLLGAPIILTFSLCVLALAAWSTATLQAQLGRVPSTRGVSVAVATVWAAFSFALWTAGQFGQREHLVLLLVMPYLVSRSLRCAGTRLMTEPPPGPNPLAPFPAREGGRGMRSASLPASGMDQERGWQGFALGLAAGCGLCLKPQYALAAAALEGYWLLWTRRFRILRSPELFGLVAVPVLYLLHFVLLPAAMRDAFLHRWLPLVAARYSIYDVPLATMVTPSIVLSTLLAGVAIVAALRLQERVGVMIGALGVFTGAAVAVYFLQHKGWPYHPLPAFGGTALLLVLLGACLVSQTTPRRPRDLVVPLLLGIVWTIVVRQGCVMDFGVWEPPLASLLKRYTHRGEPVLILSPNVVPAYPLLVHEDRRPGSRYLWSFTIPMLAAANPASAAGRPEWIVAAEQAFLRDLNDDIEARKPPLILIQSSEQWAPLSVLRYLDGSVVAETVTRTYVRLPDTIGFAVFVAPDRLSGEHQAPS